MTRPAPHRLLACALSAVAAGGLVATGSPAAAARPARGPVPTSAAAAKSAPDTPLRVTLETLAPGTIPRRGRVTLSGRIYNRSDEEWSDLNVYLLTSTNPLHSRKALADAAATDADAEIGERRVFDRVGDVAPGQWVRYRLSVSRADLGISGAPGVYWVGVHVLGASPEGRDRRADGRARTFMPLLPDPASAAGARARTRLAVLVPLQKPVQRGSAGRLVDIGSWEDSLALDGRLGRLLSVTRGVRQPLTWVVDPAVLDAVQSLARGNPAADGPETGDDEGKADADADADADQTRVTRRARAWLARFRRQAPLHTVAAVPYGDLDVAAALQEGMRPVYRLGTELSRDVLTGLGIDAFTPVVDPVGGFLPQAVLERLGTDATVVLGRAALPGSAHPVVRRAGVAPVVLTDTSAEGGGPQPNSQFAALAVRQRLLSEAALHAMSAQRTDPLVVSMPEYWNPGDAAVQSRLFAGLDTSWLTLVDLPAVVASAPTPGARASTAELVDPEDDVVEPVPLANLVATRDLVATAKVFGGLLAGPDAVEDRFARVAMLASSSAVRTDPGLALGLAQGTTTYIRDEMAKVRVEGPQFVMMSGESGRIQLTLVNGLDRSVRVGLTVDTPGSDLRIRDVDPVTLGPGRRTSIRLQARSNELGVHAVALTAVNADRVPLGLPTQLNVRTSNVSTVIWVVMGVGGTLLFLAIALRLYRRVRLRKRTHGPGLTGGTRA